MKSAWVTLLISAFTDGIIASGGIVLVISQGDSPATRNQIITCIVTGVIAIARTINQALKHTPEMSAALKGDESIVTTKTIEKTP